MVSSELVSTALSRHALRQTPVRRAVLHILLSSPFALSGHEIELRMGGTPDRITLYRTLKTFEESGLIHRVIDTSDTARYAACSVECTAHTHFDDHVHFKCTSCERVYCLHHVAVPAVTLPTEFAAQTSAYLLAGTCPDCRSHTT